MVTVAVDAPKKRLRYYGGRWVPSVSGPVCDYTGITEEDVDKIHTQYIQLLNRLTRLSFPMLMVFKALLENVGKEVSRDQLAGIVLSTAKVGSANLVRTILSKTRTALKNDPDIVLESAKGSWMRLEIRETSALKKLLRLQTQITCNDVTLDIKEISYQGYVIRLTTSVYRLLLLLFCHPYQPISRADLLIYLFGTSIAEEELKVVLYQTKGALSAVPLRIGIQQKKFMLIRKGE